jgi:FkbM family methyltransferase
MTNLAAQAYRGPIAAVARQLHINDLYWIVMTRVVGEEYTHRVGDASATFQTDSSSETRQVVNLGNEGPVVYDLLDELRPTDIFHDIGANIGIYSLLAAAVVGGNNVVAVEPHPPTANRLRDNAVRSGVDLQVLELALSIDAGRGNLSVPTDQAGVLFSRVDPEGDVPVRLKRGDSIVEDGSVPAPTVLKIDVEGTEPDVLHGYGDCIADFRVVYVETHGNGDELRALLGKNGFTIDVIHERDGQRYLKATSDR